MSKLLDKTALYIENIAVKFKINAFNVRKALHVYFKQPLREHD